MSGRGIAVLFALPALYFLRKGWIAKPMKPRLVIYTGLLAFQVKLVCNCMLIDVLFYNYGFYLTAISMLNLISFGVYGDYDYLVIYIICGILCHILVMIQGAMKD